MHTLKLKEKIQKQRIRTLEAYFGPEAVVVGLALSLMIAIGVMAKENAIPIEKIIFVAAIDAFAMLAALIAIASGVYNLSGFMAVWGALNALEKHVNK